MEIFIGFIVAFVTVLLLFGGIALGWYLRGKYGHHVTAEALTESQRQRIRDEEQAWHCLHNYSVEDAYQMPRRQTE